MGPTTQFLNQRQKQNAAVLENTPHFLVPHLRQRRIHHEDQPDGDWHGGRADAEAVEEGHDAGNKVPESDAHRHSRKDPQREVTIRKRKSGAGCETARDICVFDQHLGGVGVLRLRQEPERLGLCAWNVSFHPKDVPQPESRPQEINFRPLNPPEFNSFLQNPNPAPRTPESTPPPCCNKIRRKNAADPPSFLRSPHLSRPLSFGGRRL